jgi:hypothetical protein
MATNIKLAASAVLGTVTDTASVISDTAKTLSGAVRMANTFVENASIDQRDRATIHRKVFRDQLLRDSRMEIARSNNEVVSFCKESPENKALYEQAEEYLPENVFGD